MTELSNYFNQLEYLVIRNKHDFLNEIEKVIHDESLIKIKNILLNEKLSFAIKKIEALLTNKNLKKITITTILCSIIFCSKSVVFAEDNATTAFLRSDEYSEVLNFIKYIIMVMRSLAASICGLLVTKTGLNILIEDNTDGMRETKKTFQKIIFALFLCFAGAALATLLAKKLLSGIRI